MAGNNFDIRDLFTLTFNQDRGQQYNFTGQAASDQGQFVQMRNTIGGTTPLGTPLFMPMEIGGYKMPNEPTLLINGRKEIVETNLVGSTRRGSVKELISISDYMLTIRGIAINYEDTKIYPEDLVKDINDLYLRRESLEIKCALASLLGIYRIVIKSISFPEMMGVQHAQAYELQCVSDEDFTLEID